MSDELNNTQDDEFRVLGKKQQPEKAPDTPQKGNRKPASLVSLLVVLAIGLAIYFSWPKTDKPDTDPGVFDPTPTTVEPAPIKNLLGNIPDSLGTKIVERLDTTINDVQLALYIPHNLTPRLSVGAPDIETRNALLAFQAADIRADNRKILGAFVLEGKPLAWGLSKKGYCAIINGKVTIGVADNSPLFEEATEKEGYFFRQYGLVDNGKLVENEPKNKTMRKAICERAGQIFVVVSETDESLHDFAQALVDLGVNNAIYLVGSHSAFGWWKNDAGEAEYFSLDSHRQSYLNENYLVWD
ncbi:MAG: hypothetical protein IKH24_08205 [Bacteroidales bacterium]|nr:hypothetical protein [Bacteroidales bacterium]